MEFYEVLAKRRTIRDFCGKKVSDELLQKILGAAFKAPSNDHLHQLDEMFVDALPKQQKMLVESNCLVLPFFRQKDYPLCKPAEQCSLNYFASAWAAMENIFLAATAEGLACAFRIPINGESAHVKALVGAPEDYELTCFLTVGYPAPDAFIPTQKVIDVRERIHSGKW